MRWEHVAESRRWMLFLDDGEHVGFAEWSDRYGWDVYVNAIRGYSGYGPAGKGSESERRAKRTLEVYAEELEVATRQTEDPDDVADVLRDRVEWRRRFGFSPPDNPGATRALDELWRTWIGTALHEEARRTIPEWDASRDRYLSWLRSPTPELDERSPYDLVLAGGDLGALIELTRTSAG